MDPIPSIQAILATFPAVTDDAVRAYLPVIDSLLNMSDIAVRPIVADMVRSVATASATEERRTMLLDAAMKIEAVRSNSAAPAVTWRDDPVADRLSEPASGARTPRAKRGTIMMTADGYRQRNTRKASILHVGGFRPTRDTAASNFGLAPLGLPGEAWPAWNAKPLLFVCQMNLAMAPAVPPLLEGIQLITFFVDADMGDLQPESGADWQLRTYTSLDGLVPIPIPADAPRVKKGFECRWEVCDDHPTNDDPDLVSPAGVRRPRVGLENVARTKIGGYASTIQSELWWDHTAHPSDPKFCLQIDSEEKAGLFWGDRGTIYLARGTAPGSGDRWFLDWQCL